MSLSLEDYAQSQVGQFLPADSGPPASNANGDLTGQCVTLEKWIFLTFTAIPNPFAGRGDARYLGINLVKQGHAVEVSRADARPGDTVCYEYGQYGHTGTLLSGNRFFQQNANTGGAKKLTLPDGTVVYSATIVPLYASLGGVAPKFYRLITFKEDSSMYSKAKIAPQLVVEHFSNYTNGHTQVKATDPAAIDRFEIVGDDADSSFWRGLNTHQLDIIKGLDAQVAELKRQMANGAGTEFEPVAEVDGVATLWRKKA